MFGLERPEIIQLIGIIVALLVGIVSIIISIFTLRQNSKMIEESTRPIISVYGESINPGTPFFYIVIRNFGQSPATITKFSYDFDFIAANAYTGENPARDYLGDLNTAFLAPGQSKICRLNYKNINKPVTFTIEYKSSTKTYKDKMTVNLKAGIRMLTSKVDKEDVKALSAISYTLQEMLQRSI